MGSVVVADLNVFGILARPAKADPPLLVDPDTVLSGAISRESFKSVAGRNPKMVEFRSRVELVEFHFGAKLDIGGKTSGTNEIKDLFSFGIAEAVGRAIMLARLRTATRPDFPIMGISDKRLGRRWEADFFPLKR